MLRNTFKWNRPNETIGIKYLPSYIRKEYGSSKQSCNNYRKNNGGQKHLLILAKAFRSIESRRSIFTLADRFSIRLQTDKLAIGDGCELRDRIETNFRESGINKLFAEDLLNILIRAEDAKHLQLIFDIIRTFLEDDCRLDVTERVSLVSTFLSMCIHLNELDTAKIFWNQSSIELYKRRWMTLKYYAFLYNNGGYDEIVDEYDKKMVRLNETRIPNMFEPHSVVVLAALARLGTNEALGKMLNIIDKQSLRDKALKRKSIVLCSWTAFKLNNLGRAYDLLTSKLKYGGLFDDGDYGVYNLKLAILVDTGRLQEASVLLHSLLNRKAYNDSKTFRNVTICYDTMKRYTNAIKEQKEEDFIKDAIRICQAIDERANLTEFSLEEIIFQPIHLESRDFSQDRRRDRPRKEKERRKGITGSQH